MKWWMVLVCGMVVNVGARAATPDIDEIWAIVQEQQQRIERLEASLLAKETQLRETNQQLVKAQEQLGQQLASTVAMIEAGDSTSFGNDSGVSIGGYGEVHYNNTDSGDQIDFHRFVLYFGHQFSDNLSFYSELEIEHALAGDGAPGEVELEQAFVQWDYAPGHRVKGGLFLLPVGILNETHEPNTFYGVERNSIENRIIPTTWWEAGVMFDGELMPGLGYNFSIHSGLNLDMSSTNPARQTSLRSARQKVAEANGDSLAYTGRVTYLGLPGVSVGATLQYQSDLTQGDDDGIGISNIDATLFETDVAIQRGIFGFRALYARWDIDDRIELVNPGAQTQVGWLIEPSVRFDKVGLFARYGTYDLTAGQDVASDSRAQIDVGINYWMHQNVVIKADLQWQRNDGATNIDGFNLGIGYSF